jgi:hypothetical protein
MEYANKFRNQRTDWIKPSIFEQLCGENYIANLTSVSPEDFECLGLYLDKSSGLFYPSEFIFNAVKKHENDPN